MAQTALGPHPGHLCIDGPTASGKGTVAAAVARAGLPLPGFGRCTASRRWRPRGAGHRHQANEAAARRPGGALPVRFEDGRIWLGRADVTDAIRTERRA